MFLIFSALLTQNEALYIFNNFVFCLNSDMQACQINAWICDNLFFYAPPPIKCNKCFAALIFNQNNWVKMNKNIMIIMQIFKIIASKDVYLYLFRIKIDFVLIVWQSIPNFDK